MATINLTVAEFFAGIGLMRLGLERAGWSVVYANDIAPDKEEIYHANFTGDHFHLGDIREVEGSAVPSATLVTASFPCTDLSLAGGRLGLAGAQSSMLWEFTRVLSEMRQEKRLPPFVLLENVVGFLTSHGGKDFRAALLELNSLGYAVDAFILDASWWVPQSRVRMFVVGVQRDLLEKNEASPIPLTNEIRPPLLTSFMLQNQDIAWNIRIVPPPVRQTRHLSDIVVDVPDEHPDWWNEERKAYFFNQMSERHQLVVSEMMKGEEWSYGTAFRRMRQGRSMAEVRTDGIAGCLRTPKGGSGRQILVRAGKGRVDVRLLSARECARLMGVPNAYKLDVPLNQALFAMGDAVCVNAVEWIGKHYLDPLIEELSL